MRHDRPRLTFERIAAGEVYADREIELTQQMVADYAAAVGAINPPAFLMAASWTVPRVSFTRWQVPPGGIHARQSWRAYHALPGAGKLRVRTAAKDKYYAKGRPYVVFESVVVNEDGLVLGRGEMTILWPG